jgi:hypothetical protein
MLFPQVLPDVSDWPYVGERELNGEPVHLWRYEKKYVLKVNKAPNAQPKSCLHICCLLYVHDSAASSAGLSASVQAQRESNGVQVRTDLQDAQVLQWHCIHSAQ